MLELEQRGVDIVELGVPFSDPMADGTVNQASAQRALLHNVSLLDVLAMVERLRARTDLPIVLFTYYNPVHHVGLEAFVDRVADAGVDGVLALDLPPEEAGDYKRLLNRGDLDTIFLVAPTSREHRIRLISSVSTGFVYCVSRTGVTGERERLSDRVRPMVESVRCHTTEPIAVGFGVSKPDQVSEIAAYADAVVVGSAIVRKIGEEAEKGGNLISNVGQFVETLVGPSKGVTHGH